MKVLLFDTTQAYFTPGGKTVHAVKLQQELSKINVDIQFSRWWDESQNDCDIIHFLSPDPIAKYAKANGKKTVLSMIFDFESSKSEFDKRSAILKNKMVDLLPSRISSKSYWHTFPCFDHILFMHKYDRENALRYFKNIMPEKTSIIPHAYDSADMNLSNDYEMKGMLPEKYLISCANISQRKQSVKLAKLAKLAKVPIVFIGKSNKEDSYYKKFENEIDNQFVFYPGYVSNIEKDYIFNHASGYVLLSLGESGCIAVYEAAAYRLPLLLSNLPWAWGYEKPENIFFCNQEDSNKSVSQLKNFYDGSNKLDKPPFTIYTWADVALMYKKIYINLLDE